MSPLGKKKNWRKTVVGTAVALAATFATALGGAANAAVYTYPNAVDPASITVTQTSGRDGVTVTDRLRISANWSVPAGAKAGETFGLTLPAEFSRFTGTFPLAAIEDPSKTVAECTVGAESPAVVVCTLTDYVDGRDGTRGSLWFDVSASRATESSTVEFVVGDAVVAVDLPGAGGIGTPGAPSLPTNPAKDGWISSDGRLGWQITFPGAAVSGSDTVHVADDLAAGGPDAAAHHNVDGRLQLWSTDAAGGDRRNITGFTGGWNAEGSAFAIDIAGPLDASRLYVVRYHTVPDVPQAGGVYVNRAVVNGTQVADRVTWDASGGGDGTGPTTPVVPTDPPVEPTEPTDPPVEPTDPPVEPTDPPVQDHDEPTPTASPAATAPVLASTGGGVPLWLIAASVAALVLGGLSIASERRARASRR